MVRIRMKKMGRTHRPFFRICAVDSRAPRDGKVIEELGHYDPMIRETDARVLLKNERIDYWISVGAQPSDNVKVFIKKYGTSGTHLEQQKEARERLNVGPVIPEAVKIELPTKEEPKPAEEAAAPADAEAPAAEEAAAPAEEAAADPAPEAAAEAPAEEKPAEAPAEEAKKEAAE